MWRLERAWEERNRTAVLLAAGAIILTIAIADWWTKPDLSLEELPIRAARKGNLHWIGELLDEQISDDHIEGVWGKCAVSA